jgi:hypothetical protein
MNSSGSQSPLTILTDYLQNTKGRRGDQEYYIGTKQVIATLLDHCSKGNHVMKNNSQTRHWECL